MEISGIEFSEILLTVNNEELVKMLQPFSELDKLSPLIGNDRLYEIVVTQLPIGGRKTKSITQGITISENMISASRTVEKKPAELSEEDKFVNTVLTLIETPDSWVLNPTELWPRYELAMYISLYEKGGGFRKKLVGYDELIMKRTGGDANMKLFTIAVMGKSSYEMLKGAELETAKQQAIEEARGALEETARRFFRGVLTLQLEQQELLNPEFIPQSQGANANGNGQKQL